MRKPHGGRTCPAKGHGKDASRPQQGGRANGAASRRERRAVDPRQARTELERQLRAHYGADLAARIEAGYAAQRPVTFRANSLKSTPEAVAAALDAAGVPWRTSPWCPGAFVVDAASERDVRALPLYESGGIYLQSLSSMVPPLVLAPKPGESVLDMAAAPGGKTTQMAALSGNKAQITAVERSAPRAERLRFNLERQGAGRVSVLVQDARTLDSFFRFDKILLDAPCSGSGTVRATADEGGEEVWKTGYSDVLLENCRRTQSGLLRKAFELLPAGGELVYSTCSVLPPENELMVADAVERAAGAGILMEVVPIDPDRFPGIPLLPCGLAGALCICPDDECEGFFVCHLRRR